MIYRLDILPDALNDIEREAQWYEDQQSGLGADFVNSVLEAIDTLPSNPLIYRIRHRRRNVRWLLMHKFPFRVVYRISDDLITVFAVLHSARHDRHWRKRI